MGKYTVELRELIEHETDIGLKNYPIWSEEYRDTLNKKIIDHYYFREIGFETPGRFIHALNTKMNEIMSYYVKLWATTILDYDPLEVVNYTEEYERSTENSSSLNNTETGTSQGQGTVAGKTTAVSDVNNNHSESSTKENMGKNVEVDTPAGNLISQTIDTLSHASKINHDKASETITNESEDNQHSSSESNDNTTTTTSSNLTNTLDSQGLNNEVENYKKHIKGNYTSTSYQALIQKEREIILNIDLMIIKDLNELFLGIFS